MASSTTSAAAASTASSMAAANLFQVPHSRLKELAEAHLKQVGGIKKFSSVGGRKGSSSAGDPVPDGLAELLQAVYEAMWELKSHEYIENHFIMDRLKARLQAKRVRAVPKGHKGLCIPGL